jgi:hypothetical protein
MSEYYVYAILDTRKPSKWKKEEEIKYFTDNFTVTG